MARILNFAGYFIGSICWVCVAGLTTRYYTQLQNWYWMFFTLFLVCLIGLSSYYARKSYTGLLNTSEAVLLGLVITLFVGCVLGGIASYV
jgi:MFS family permease